MLSADAEVKVCLSHKTSHRPAERKSRKETQQEKKVDLLF